MKDWIIQSTSTGSCSPSCYGAGGVTCTLVAEKGFFGILEPLDLNSLPRLIVLCKDI